MNEMLLVRNNSFETKGLLTPARAKELLEEAGAVNVSVKTRISGKMWVFFTHEGKNTIWSLRLGALERNVAREVAVELTVQL